MCVMPSVTADFYGRHVANQLIKEALYPYLDELHIVTKVGVVRDTEGGRQRLRPGGHQLRSRSTRSRNWRVATGGWRMNVQHFANGEISPADNRPEGL